MISKIQSLEKLLFEEVGEGLFGISFKMKGPKEKKKLQLIQSEH